MDEYYQVIRHLPSRLCQSLESLPCWQAADVQEIRLRAGQAVLFTVSGRLVPASQYSTALSGICGERLTREQLRQILLALCGRSLHTYEKELAQGYFTLPGGHRVGVGACYLLTEGQYTLETVTSLNLRIARKKAVELPQQIGSLLKTSFTGLALIGPPLSGKTTVLRSMADYLGAIGRTCAVIDERKELFPGGNDAISAGNVDVIAGMEKGTAVQLALRTLSPQVILLDELGALAEADALQQAFFSGVDFVFTLHASNISEAERRIQFQTLKNNGMLRCVCALAGRSAPGMITEVRYY